MENNNEVILSAFNVYKKYYLRLLLLEIFGKNEPLDNSEIIKRLYSDVRKGNELYHSTTMNDIMTEYEYLVKIGYFTSVENEEKITLSEIGKKALRECVWENLSSSAFFGYKGLYISNIALDTSKKALYVSILTFIVSLAAVLIAVYSMYYHFK